MLELNRTEALSLIAQTTFHPFTNADYMSFSGVTSDKPYIGENGDYLIILDGNTIQFQDMEGDFQSFYITE